MADKGRSQTTVDWQKVDQLLEAGCLGTEVAAYFGIHADTFYKKVVEKHGVCFTAYQQEKRSKGDSLLRAKQYQVAMNGDKTMLIWLGKNRIGQKDEHNLSQTVNLKIINYSDAQIPDTPIQIQSTDLPIRSIESA